MSWAVGKTGCLGALVLDLFPILFFFLGGKNYACEDGSVMHPTQAAGDIIVGLATCIAPRRYVMRWSGKGLGLRLPQSFICRPNF